MLTSRNAWDAYLDRTPQAISELENNLAPMEPVTHVPQRQQDRTGLGDGREIAEEGKPESKDADGSVQPGAENFFHRVDENRVRADYDQRKGPLGVALRFDHPKECEKHQEHPAGAEDRKRGESYNLFFG
jgi:hypothetical protein